MWKYTVFVQNSPSLARNLFSELAVTRGNLLKMLGIFCVNLQGPFTEEFVFRACMLPVLVPSLGENWSLLLCPLFFGFGKSLALCCHLPADL